MRWREGAGREEMAKEERGNVREVEIRRQERRNAEESEQRLEIK